MLPAEKLRWSACTRSTIRSSEHERSSDLVPVWCTARFAGPMPSWASGSIGSARSFANSPNPVTGWRCGRSTPTSSSSCSSASRSRGGPSCRTTLAGPNPNSSTPRKTLAPRCLFCDRDPGGLAHSVDRVIRLDTDEYESLLADVFDRRSGRRHPGHSRHVGRALLHRRDDRRVEGRDAHARQPHGQCCACPARSTDSR